MVQVGRDSDACVCAVKKETGASLLLRGATAGALAAVERRRQEEAAAAQEAVGDDRPIDPGLLPSFDIPLPGPAEPPATP